MTDRDPSPPDSARAGENVAAVPAAVAERIAAAIGARRAALVDFARALHGDPELGLVEHRAVARQIELLRGWGFDAESPYGGLDTAFRATWPAAADGREATGDGPTLAFLSEYDALPGLGHACGHNLIATVALGAAAGLQAALAAARDQGDHDQADHDQADHDQADHDRGGQGYGARVVVLGTPGEEGKGGKPMLLANGGFADIDVALMAHPYPCTTGDMGGLGVEQHEVVFHGRAAHAASAPEQGRNALDAMHLLYGGVNAWRQHLPELCRVHGVVTDGGAAPNIVPDRSAATWYLRAPDLATQEGMRARFQRIAEGAALMTDTTVTVTPSACPPYAPGNPNPVLNAAWLTETAALGMAPEPSSGVGRFSTDFGNVSQRLPGLHGYFGIVEPDTALHTETFAAAAGSDEAIAQALSAAEALARVGYRLAMGPDFARHVQSAFQASRPPA